MAAVAAVIRDSVISAMFGGVAANMTDAALRLVTARAYPVRDRVIALVMCVMDVFGRFVGRDVVREVQNLL
jgi:hypothetical protein